METLETCWTYSGFEEWMDCWILVIHLLLHHLSCLKGKEICLCCNCFSWFMVCIVFVGCRSRIFFSLFLVLLLLCCFSCCSSLSSLSTIFPVAVFVLVAVSPGVHKPGKIAGCHLRATDVHRANKNYIYIIIIGVLSIHQLSSVQFRYSSKDFQSFEVLLEGGRFPLPCRGDNLWWLPLQGTRSEEIMDVDLQ